MEKFLRWTTYEGLTRLERKSCRLNSDGTATLRLDNGEDIIFDSKQFTAIGGEGTGNFHDGNYMQQGRRVLYVSNQPMHGKHRFVLVGDGYFPSSNIVDGAEVVITDSNVYWHKCDGDRHVTVIDEEDAWEIADLKSLDLPVWTREKFEIDDTLEPDMVLNESKNEVYFSSAESIMDGDLRERINYYWVDGGAKLFFEQFHKDYSDIIIERLSLGKAINLPRKLYFHWGSDHDQVYFEVYAWLHEVVFAEDFVPHAGGDW